MLEIKQKTISKTATFKGVGLHSGKISTVKIHPADADHGIVFKRIDLKNNNIIKANFSNVSSARLCTTLENENGVKVSTVEHLMAALYFSGIDNALVEVNSDEIPILDGSAKEFLNIIKQKNVKTQIKNRKYLKIEKKIELVDGDRRISIEPSNNNLEVEFHLEYENKIIGKQNNNIDCSSKNLDEIINSRTFCLFKDIEKIKKAGLAKGGSLENAIVVDDNKVLNESGLRNSKEFVNHKILDLVGDFLLSGYRILGKVKCHQGGHELTNMFLRKIFKEKTALKISEIDQIFLLRNNKLNSLTKLAVNY